MLWARYGQLLSEVNQNRRGRDVSADCHASSSRIDSFALHLQTQDNQLRGAARSMRTPVFVLFLAVSGVLVTGGQTSDTVLQARLERLFPAATSFSPKEGNPPHFKAYRDDAGNGGEPTLVGFAFYTTDLEPLERGYDGPIRVLVGMDTGGVLISIVVVDHNEPYGYFSIDPPEFAVQFVRKSIRDRFRVGGDIDAISTATLTVTSTSRAVRNGARRLARQVLNPEDVR